MSKSLLQPLRDPFQGGSAPEFPFIGVWLFRLRCAPVFALGPQISTGRVQFQVLPIATDFQAVGHGFDLSRQQPELVGTRNRLARIEGYDVSNMQADLFPLPAW